MEEKSHDKHKTHAHKHKSHGHKHSHRHASHSRKPVQDSSNSLKNAAIVVLVLALIAVVIWSVTNDSMPKVTSGSSSGPAPTAAAGVEVSEEVQEAMRVLADDDPYLGAADAPVVIVEFSDFQCPYCAKFYKDTLPELKKNFVDTGVVKFVYRDLALSFHNNAQKSAEASMCAHEQGKFWEYHDVLFANQQMLDVNSLKKYAADVGLDVAQFESCLTSSKYADEVKKDGQAANANGIQGTPGFIINGQKLSGALPYDKFVQVICAQAPQSQPCKDIPPPVELMVTVLNDKKCSTCDPAQIKQVTLELFPGASFKEVDASSTEGKALISDHGLTYAPAYLFPEAVTETNTWKTNTQIQGAFDKIDTGYRLKDEAVGASWFLSEEAREAYFAELNVLLDRTAGDNMPQVDFFVMSYCPYGNQAEELLKPVFDKLKGQAQFNPRYVVYNRGNGCYTDTDGTQLCSLHGEVELNQDMRELCVFNNYGEQEWFDFAIAMNSQCNQNNADTCWEGVAASLNLDTAMIDSCFEENKLSYAREQFDLNMKLGVTGSPTLFFEAEQFNGARSSNAYLAALCAGFDDAPAACDGVVAEPTRAAAPQGSC